MARTISAGRRPLRLPFFYGWLIVGVVFVTMAIAVNARTAFSLRFPPILDEFRLGSRGDRGARSRSGFWFQPV